MESNYTLAWSVYLGAVVVAQLLLWWPLRQLPFADARRLIQLCVFAMFITPARLDPGSDFWVPAFMAALMDALEFGSEAALARVWPILAVMLVLVLASSLLRMVPVWRARSRLSDTGST